MCGYTLVPVTESLEGGVIFEAVADMGGFEIYIEEGGYDPKTQTIVATIIWPDCEKASFKLEYEQTECGCKVLFPDAIKAHLDQRFADKDDEYLSYYRNAQTAF